MSIELPQLSTAERQTRPRRTGQVLILTAGVLLGCMIAAMSGCAPLGLYSLGHSLVAHHVLKPVIADEPAADAKAVGDKACDD